MAILENIVEELESSDGPLTKKELAKRVGVEESALDGMLEFLERKGKLSVCRPSGFPRCDAGLCVGCVFTKPRGRDKE